MDKEDIVKTIHKGMLADDEQMRPRGKYWLGVRLCVYSGRGRAGNLNEPRLHISTSAAGDDDSTRLSRMSWYQFFITTAVLKNIE